MATRCAATASAAVLPTVTMVGAGQLARMTHQAAIALGQRLRVLAASPDDPAARVNPNTVFGSYNDLEVLRRAAVGSHAVTFDHEHVPTEHLHALVDEGVVVAPPPSALIYAQDKLMMRQRLAELDMPVPAFAPITTPVDAAGFGAVHGWPIVLKAVRGGYDGRGVWMPVDATAAGEVVSRERARGVELLAEERVRLRRELSAMVARSPFGQGAAWPVVQTVQVGGQCSLVIAPAPGLDADVGAAAEGLALRLASELGVVGVMAVELFETIDGRLLVNELAMRPHNSGHWTIDGSRTSQFEQHLRAVVDYPLGDTSPTAPVSVMANILGAPAAPAMGMDERLHHLFARMPDAKVHLYGKDERPARKVGHITVLGNDADLLRERAERAAQWMSTAGWSDGWDPHER